MKTTKSCINTWHTADDSGKIVARITKERGIYKVFLRNVFTGVMEHFTNAVSFKEAKQFAIL